MQDRARLAKAGDHIDFVVTLLAADGETVGRLERQTEGGTVAIRELRDPSCSRVADALALSLALSLEPGKARSAPATELDSPSAPLASNGSEAPAAAPAATQLSPPTRRSVDEGRAPTHQLRGGAVPAERVTFRATEAPFAKDLRGGWLGLQGGALVGVAPQALVRSAAFVGFLQPWPELLKGSALRLGAVGTFGSISTSIGAVRQWLLAGRVEGCPVRWGRPILSVAPCLAFELGATSVSAEGTTVARDTGPWVAAGAGLRGTALLMPALALEAQAEAQLPLLRNDVYAGPEAVYRAKSVAFQGGLGLSMRVW